MYGLLLEAMYDYIKSNLSEEEWLEIVSLSGIQQSNFVTHACYSESLIGQVAEATAEMSGLTLDQILENLGAHFVTFVSRYGYDTVLKVLGRNVRDFLNGLDNLHEYLRLSYPKMMAPSFSCDNETPSGLMLHYRSKRGGFTYYVMGQIRQVGLIFYNTEIEIEIVRNTVSNKVHHVILKLHFDNKGFSLSSGKVNQTDLPMMKSVTFFRCFPFHVVFGRDMLIRHVGTSLQSLLPDLVNTRLDHKFELTKPLVEFTYENIMAYTNNIFYMQSTSEIDRRTRTSAPTSDKSQQKCKISFLNRDWLITLIANKKSAL
ncbi:hypothetical protein LSH36_596g01000 [Paralvinella palmiformis]|uniref:guanylate cyclase n=1 Tax=Paralvinella palmiformis TaxID=53620 RepID=A0AAD9J551_9ANNE|nr:hypothetical protein LSH36_596g01000 [Paralvinella palmiformis]